MSSLKRTMWKLYFPFLERKFLIKNKLKKMKGVQTDKDSYNLVVSLTSMPSRIDKLYITIETLLSQTFKPNTIQLWLGRDELSMDDIPESLLRLQARGLEICWIDKTMRSYDKLIPALKMNDNSIIVTADDDVLYPTWWLERLYKKWLENQDCIICYRAKNIIKVSKEKLAPYAKWPNIASSEPALDIFPTGVGGVLYPPNSLAANILNEKEFLNLSPTNDDIWFKAMSLIQDTKCCRVFPKNMKWKSVLGTNAKSLAMHNNKGIPGERPNDIQLHNVFKKYDLHKKISLKP
jgi:hypothetical protein